MTWEKKSLSEIIVVKKGEYITKKEIKEGPYPVILGGREPAYYIDHFNHNGKAIIVSRSGASAGFVSFWNEPIFVTDGFLIEPTDSVNIDFLYYLMKSKEIQFLGMQGGAAIPHITPRTIGAVDILLPDAETQRKIASILATYDNLIENNQKQIKLLEEAAQRLYKEWFVDLRFPGYENVPVVDGVPEGWSNGILGDIANDVGKNKKEEKLSCYSYYLPIDCLPKKSLAYTSTNDVSLAESSLVSFRPNDILFGAMRPYFHKVVIARDVGLTRSTCFVINAKENFYWSYLVMLLFSEDTVNYATRISVGTTMPYTRWKDFVQMPVIIPAVDVVTEFEKQFSPIANKISRLAEQNIRLIQTRDRLLPKLMNGEIEV